MIFSEMTTMRKLMLLHGVVGGKSVEDFASGNPCVFTTDLAKPLRRLALTLLPKQSGTGDPSPENIRPLLPWGEVGTWHGGANLFDGNYVTGLIQNTAESAWYRNTGTSAKSAIIPCRPNTQYTIHKIGYASSNRFSIGLTSEYPENNMPVTLVVEDSGQGEKQRTFTTGADDYFIIVYVSTGSEMAEPDMMVNYGATALPFTPYSPITPFPVNLRKNLLDDTQKAITSNNIYIGTTKTGFDDNHSVYLKAGTYTFSVETYDGKVTNLYVREEGESTNLVRAVNVKTATFTVDHDAWFIVWVYKVGYAEVGTGAVVSAMINTGETAEPFQPYLPPVYGCELDLTTGEVWGTWASFSAKWKDGVSTGTVGGTVERKSFSMPVVFVNATGAVSAYCNVAKWKWNYEEASTHFYSHASTSYVFLPTDTDGETDILIVGKLKTPVLLATLTPQQINALIGVNTVWSDADGIELTYLKKG